MHGDQERLVRDAASNACAVKQGLTWEIVSPFGVPGVEGFHFVLSSPVIGLSRISPRGYTQAAFGELGLKPLGAGDANGQHWDETLCEMRVAAD